MTDFLGNEIKVGDEIVYPNRSGSSMWMCRGTVTALRPRASYRGLRTVLDVKLPDGKKVVVEKLSRVVVVKHNGGGTELSHGERIVARLESGTASVEDANEYVYDWRFIPSDTHFRKYGITPDLGDRYVRIDSNAWARGQRLREIAVTILDRAKAA